MRNVPVYPSLVEVLRALQEEIHEKNITLIFIGILNSPIVIAALLCKAKTR